MKARLEAVIFDLDGVLVRTDEHHFQSWQATAEAYDIPFSRKLYDTRLRGLNRNDAAATLLEGMATFRSQRARQQLLEAKQQRFLALLTEKPPRAVRGAEKLLSALKRANLKLAVGSSSGNARKVLCTAGLSQWFEAIVDGDDAPGKPAPDIFLEAARRLGISPRKCLVVEDSRDGVAAARRAKMRVIAVGPASRFDRGCDCVTNLSTIRERLFEQAGAHPMVEKTSAGRG